MKKQLILFPLLVMLFSAGNNNPGKHSIRLRWYKTYEGETWNHAETGLLWTLSYLGAMLPGGCKEKLIVRDRDSVSFTLNLSQAGFTPATLNHWQVIVDSLKKTDEYIQTGSIDMGRFIMLTQNSPWHYYKLTGAFGSITEFKKNHPMDDAYQYLVEHSGVAKGERLVRFAPFTHWSEIAFIAEEGEGSVKEGNFRPREFEVFDVMPNGQLRFAVYGEDGKLKPAADTTLGLAGKPSKCLWCHESSLQPLFYGSTEVPGFISSAMFLSYIDTGMYMIRSYRDSLSTEIDFQNTHHHTWSELTYTGFMNPTAERIAMEFGCSIDEARTRTRHLPLHDDHNFPFYYRPDPYFGLYKNLFSRYHIDSLLPYRTTRVPADALEERGYEPDFFR